MGFYAEIFRKERPYRTACGDAKPYGSDEVGPSGDPLGLHLLRSPRTGAEWAANDQK
jgi:hypothetical protein